MSRYQESKIDLATGNQVYEEERKTELSASDQGKIQQEIEVVVEDAQSSGLKVRDHFSLNNPSSAVKFNQGQSYIFSTQMDQLVLERKGNEIIARRMQEDSPGLAFARGLYTVIAFLMAGFLFVFCVQLLLFLFLGLAIEGGLTSQTTGNAWTFIATLLSLPVFCFGLANAMTIAQTFVVETWEGNPILKTTFAEDQVIIDWIDVFVYLLIPATTLGITLSAKQDDWWDTTALVWFLCVFVYYIVFAAVCIRYEISGAMELIQHHPKLSEVYSHIDKEDTSIKSQASFFFHALRTAILLRQRQILSGYKTVSFIENQSSGKIDRKKAAEERLSDVKFSGFWTLITEYLCCAKFYTKVEHPEDCPRYRIDEVRDETPFLTSYTWGLEKVFFRDHSKRYVTIVGGPGKLTRAQAISSLICGLIGKVLLLFAIVAFLSWMTLPGALIGIVIALYSTWALLKLNDSRKMMGAFSKASDDSSRSGSSLSDAVFQVRATFRVNEATELFCWICFVIEIIFLFILPIIGLFSTKNYNVAWVFVFTAIITGFRRFLSSSVCLHELGSLDGMELNNVNQSPDEEWREKHRLGTIVGKISSGKRRSFWIRCFIFFMAGFLLIFMAAVTLGANDGKDTPFEMLTDFEYEGNQNMKYPTCKIGKQFQVGDVDSSLSDFVFLAATAYQKPSITQEALDDWFGENVAIDEVDKVKAFREEYQEENGNSAVTYKLVSFPDTNRAIVSIRGTSNAWDALTDAQLWSSAALSQYVRAIIPLGEIWTPVFETIVKAISMIQNKRLKDVAFYQETTAFVDSLKEDGLYDSISITGHSLGGGLAAISGAQTESPVVAVSGPNNLISRLTYDPILSKEDINEFVFNIIPDRDPVPRIDDVGRLFQKIECRAPSNNPLECHYAKRTLCEIMYQCGSGGRPIFCFCKDYGYPSPIATGNRTFDEACPSA